MAETTTVYPLQENTNVDVGATPVEVLVDGNNQTVESTTQQMPVEIIVPDVTVYTVGIQGPPGPTGPTGGGEDEVAKAKRVDFEGNFIYKGRAAPGTLDAQALWEIQRIEKILGGDGKTDFTYTYANGNANETNIWNNRLALSYS